MTTITISTRIKAPIKNVFDLSRDIDFHQKSASQTGEKAIDGITSGIIELGQKVKWRGKHFGLWLTHESLITDCISPVRFTDKMIQGNFKSFVHQHLFTEINGITIMEDIVSYKTPYGLFGKLFNSIVLKNHLTRFLKTRNQALKITLE